MATTITVPTPNIHWFLYPLLLAGLGGVLWLWHDTQIKDTTALVAVQTAAKKQAADDAAAKQSISQNNAQAAKTDQTLHITLAQAKTPTQQAQVINQGAGTHIAPEPHQADNPSVVPQYVVPTTDLPILAKQTVDFQTCQANLNACQLNSGIY